MATTRLGLFGVPRERYGTTKLVIGQSNKPDVTTATASGIGNVGAVTRLGISGVPRAAYKRFAAKTPTSAATHTGTGTPTAVTATASGVGVTGVSGSGTPQAATATTSGAGVRIITIDGSRRGWLPPLDSPGWFSGWFIDAPKASRATATTASSGTKTGTGTATATTATSAGVAVRNITGTGTPQATTATTETIGGIVEGNVAGGGTPQAQGATVTAVTVRNITGSGTPAASTATGAGSGGKGIVGVSTMQANAATSSGAIILYGSWNDTTDTAATWATESAALTTYTFDSDDGTWTLPYNWVIANGVATHNANGSSTIDTAYSFTEGESYTVTFTLSDRTSGRVKPRFGGGSAVSGTDRDADGTYTETIVAGAGNTLLTFQASVTFRGSVDNVIIEPANPDQGWLDPTDTATTWQKVSIS